MKLIKTRN